MGSRPLCTPLLMAGLLMALTATVANAKPPRAAKSDKAAAAALKAKADQAFARKEHYRALDLLDEAYRLDPQPGFRANKVPVLEALGSYGEAVEILEWYLAQQPDKARRTIAQRMMTRLRPEVRVETDPPGAAVFVDGSTTSLGNTPMTTHLVAGAHVIRLELLGYMPVSSPVKVTLGRPAAVAKALKPRTDEDPEEMPMGLTAEVPPPASGSDLTLWRNVAFGVAGVGVVGAAVFYLQGKSALDERDDADDRATWQDRDDAAQGARTLHLVSAGVAVVGAITGAVLWSMEDSGAPDSGVSVSPGGVTWWGQF